MSTSGPLAPPMRDWAAEVDVSVTTCRPVRLIARRAAWSSDLPQINLALIAVGAAMVGELVDGQSACREHGKESVLLISNDVQRELAFIIDITNRVDRFRRNVLLDKRGQEHAASVPEQAANLRQVNACVVQTHVREHTPHVDDVGM